MNCSFTCRLMSCAEWVSEEVCSSIIWEEWQCTVWVTHLIIELLKIYLRITWIFCGCFDKSWILDALNWNYSINIFLGDCGILRKQYLGVKVTWIGIEYRIIRVHVQYKKSPTGRSTHKTWVRGASWVIITHSPLLQHWRRKY